MNDDIIPILALFIPIIAILAGMAIAVLAIILTYRRRKETLALYHQERIAALEKGVELAPLPDFLLSATGRPAGPYNPRRHLLKGLVWLSIGLGIGCGGWRIVGGDWALFALVPIGIGAAHLVYYIVEGKNETDTIDPDQLTSPAKA